MPYKNRNYEKYLNPRNVEIKDEEISSHSSLLFNKRLDINMEICDQVSRVSKSNPTDPSLTHEWFSAVDTIYNNIFPILTKAENNKLKKLIKEYWTTYMMIRIKKNQNQKNFWKLHMIVNELYAKIIAYLQKRQFFMRIETVERKGIATALKKLGVRK
ncbi:MAG: hypothetical protein ACTSVB_07965 [Candidatus Heimdallarchaeaceae archaeon]